MKKFVAVACLAVAASGVFGGVAQAAPGAAGDSGVPVTVPVQADPITLTPEQQNYCRNMAMSGLAGFAIGSAVGLPLFIIGSVPLAALGGFIGMGAGSSAPMPDDGQSPIAGQAPFARCSMGM
ncbi:hypothetical protein [Nocardia tengchongensis]